MQVTAILLAAGLGLRFKSHVSKPLVKIKSKPILVYSLKELSRHPLIKKIIIVANALNRDSILRLVSRYKISKVSQVVLGGKHRQDSVGSGLEAIDNDPDLVLIHDGARPFIAPGLITAVIKAAQLDGAAIAAVPVKATIKKCSLAHSHFKDPAYVLKTIDRSGLWEIQTPQVFKRPLILEAFKKFGRLPVTDDAMLIEKLKHKVRIVMGDYKNIKITTPEDLIFARGIVKGA